MNGISFLDHLEARREVRMATGIPGGPNAGLGELLAEQLQRRVVRDAVLDTGSQKPRKREAIAYLILDLLVR